MRYSLDSVEAHGTLAWYPEGHRQNNSGVWTDEKPVRLIELRAGSWRPREW